MLRRLLDGQVLEQVEQQGRKTMTTMASKLIKSLSKVVLVWEHGIV